MIPEIRYFRDRLLWIETAAKFVSDTIRERFREDGTAAIALAGGRTPQPLYERLGQLPYRDEIPWRSVHLFWGDERCVPFDDPRSNYGTAYAAFLGRVPLPPENVHSVPGTAENCSVAADTYERSLRQFFRMKSRRQSSKWPEADLGSFKGFDLIILGLGKDGHTASLFPGSPALEERKRWVVHVPDSPQPPFVPRVTLTPPAINRARMVLFLVSGSEKNEIIEKIRLEGDNTDSSYPAARVHPLGRTIWMILKEISNGKDRQ